MALRGVATGAQDDVGVDGSNRLTHCGVDPREEWAVKKRRSIRFGDTTIEYEVRRSRRRRKTVRITVDAWAVQVAAPMTTPNSLLQAFVLDQAPWIIKHLSDEKPEAEPKHFLNGGTLPYLGRNVRMVVGQADVRSPEVRFDHWCFRITAPKTLEDEERYQSIRSAITGWYRDRAAERLEATVDRWRHRMGLGDKSRILVRDQRRRWGSCAHDGTLRFNWRLVMLKPALSEYVVVHELAHLTHHNHSKNFWDLVTQVMPDAQQRRRLLREAGLTLPL